LRSKIIFPAFEIADVVADKMDNIGDLMRVIEGREVRNSLPFVGNSLPKIRFSRPAPFRWRGALPEMTPPHQ
jgi:hypothetical protein